MAGNAAQKINAAKRLRMKSGMTRFLVDYGAHYRLFGGELKAPDSYNVSMDSRSALVGSKARFS